jgi:uncharacterized protein YbjQ (UPF0145 family)
VPAESEKYPSGALFPLVDGLSRTIGWQWEPGDGQPPAFVIIGRGAMGGQKVIESYPLTPEGWAAAWRSLKKADPDAAKRILPVLEARRVRAAEAAERAAAQLAEAASGHATGPALIVTTNDIPGYRIVHVYGDVFGLTVRSRSFFVDLGSSLRSLAGGEAPALTQLLTDSRNQARARMWREAQGRGANAVVGMRFDCNSIGDLMSEVAAYGTAVSVEPVQEAGPVLGAGPG